MHRVLVVLAALTGLVAASAWGLTLHYSSGAAGLSITATNLNTPFIDNHSGGGSATFQARHILIRSRTASANSCHFDLGDGVATTADTLVAPGAAIGMDWDPTTGGVGGGWNAIGAICDTGATATWDVDAWR